MKELNLIVAVSSNGVIGANGRIPWRCREDMAFFKRATLGHAVIMGRKTFDSIGKPLPERCNIVVSRNSELGEMPGILSATCIEDALSDAYEVDSSPFVIGGSQIYRLAMPLVTRIYLTRIFEFHDGDALWPVDALSGFFPTQQLWSIAAADCWQYDRHGERSRWSEE